ncbi:MAG: ribulose-phosphate 3-epimerase [Clostridiales bacterium]|jgi:ribulose-phosphate 3-epimerase|nr:ribulose-phosphate 3-epimerase [Clostridiales bacterium]
MKKRIKIAPSLLSADYARLGEEIKEIEAFGADMLHIDVMDGHFVSNITIGAPVIKSIRKVSPIPFDVHLMVSDPCAFIDDFLDAGADIITVHFECSDNPAFLYEAIKKIKARGKRVGVSLKPHTPTEAVFQFLDIIDMVLVMTVEPGFGGQGFMSDMLPKIAKIREKNQNIDIQVDGGINNKTAPLAKLSGANILVAGSYIFGAKDRRAAINSLRE